MLLAFKSRPQSKSAAEDHHHRRLGQGFNLLAAATVAAKIIDFSTVLAMLFLLTKQQVGTASLVLSFGMVVEAFNGLGTSEALLQARIVTRAQLDSLFWYILGAAVLVGGLTLLAAPVVGAIYGSHDMAAYVVAIAIKQPIVGAALIPLALLNRNLQYERIAIINVCATLAAAVTRIGLGVAGAGAWALVAGFSASGLYILVGALFAQPFRPRFRLQAAAIVPLVRFGAGASTANIAEQMFKNVDFLLVGWFYGAPLLAVYRVAFDIAMEPAMAVSTLVNRTALPVFARVAAEGGQLPHILTWALRRTLTLIAPFLIGLMLVAAQLTALLHDAKGHSYAAAAVPLGVLAAAALLRAVSQLLPTVLLVSQRPGLAARLSATTFVLLTAGILIVGYSCPPLLGLSAVSAIWLAYLPLVLAWGLFHVRRHWRIGAGELARAAGAPLLATVLLAASAELARRFVGQGDPRLWVGIVLGLTALTYYGLFAWQRREQR